MASEISGRFSAPFAWGNVSVEHSICGAGQWLKMQFPKSGAYCIAGHHSGLPGVGNRTDLPDEATLLGQIKRKQQDFSAFAD